MYIHEWAKMSIKCGCSVNSRRVFFVAMPVYVKNYRERRHQNITSLQLCSIQQQKKTQYKYNDNRG